MNASKVKFRRKREVLYPRKQLLFENLFYVVSPCTWHDKVHRNSYSNWCVNENKFSKDCKHSFHKCAICSNWNILLVYWWQSFKGLNVSVILVLFIWYTRALNTASLCCNLLHCSKGKLHQLNWFSNFHAFEVVIVS